MREIYRRYVSSDGGSQSDCWFRGGRTHGSTPQPFIFALMCVLNTTRNPIWTLTGFPPSTPDISARPCFPSWIWGDVSRNVQCWKRDCGRYFIRSFASHVDLISVSRVSNIAIQCELLFCYDFDVRAVIWVLTYHVGLFFVVLCVFNTNFVPPLILWTAPFRAIRF